MLPYSPLHHLLLADVGVPLVMTSGNVSDEPIAYEDDDALRAARAGSRTCSCCTTGRSTRAPTTRSCAAGGSCGARAATCPRRSRSPTRRRCSRSAPSSRTRSRSPATGARGSATTSATCATTRRCAPSPTAIAHFERLFAVAPELVAHDLHPEYLSTKYALELELPAVARPAPPRPPRRVRSPSTAWRAAAGAIYDGTGYGTDGTVWGGELLRGDLTAFERVGHLWPVRMPGGEAAIREPWRMACAWLVEIGVDAPLPGIDPDAGRRSPQLARTGLASPVTTSMGRLFDAVAALLRRPPHGDLRGPGRDRARGARRPRERDARAYPHRRRGAATRRRTLVLDARATSRRSSTTSRAASRSRSIAARFHNAVAAATAAGARATSPSSSSPAACSRTSCCSRARSSALPRALVPRAPPGQRRRHRLRAGGDRCGLRPRTSARWRCDRSGA